MTSQLWGGTSWQGERGLEAARDIGYDAVELQLDDPAPNGPERREAERAVRAVGLPVSSVACIGFGLNDLRDQVRRYHVEQLKQNVDFANAIGAPLVVPCLGEYVWVGILPVEEQWAATLDSLSEVVGYAEARGVRLAVEVEALPTAMVHSASGASRLLHELDGRVHVNLDISHIGLQGASPEELEQLAGGIANVHFSDSNGRAHAHLVPGDGVLDMPGWLAAVVATGFDDVLSVELGPLDDVELGLEWAQRAYNRTHALLATDPIAP